MYTLSKEEIKECEMIKELHASYLKHRDIIANSEYPEPDSETWINYHEARQSYLKDIADKYHKHDIENAIAVKEISGIKSEKDFMKEWKK